jgi:hypothetical protein
MRTIKTYSNRAPFYNALIVQLPSFRMLTASVASASLERKAAILCLSCLDAMQRPGSESVFN